MRTCAPRDKRPTARAPGLAPPTHPQPWQVVTLRGAVQLLWDALLSAHRGRGAAKRRRGASRRGAARRDRAARCGAGPGATDAWRCSVAARKLLERCAGPRLARCLLAAEPRWNRCRCAIGGLSPCHTQPERVICLQQPLGRATGACARCAGRRQRSCCHVCRIAARWHNLGVETVEPSSAELELGRGRGDAGQMAAMAATPRRGPSVSLRPCGCNCAAPPPAAPAPGCRRQQEGQHLRHASWGAGRGAGLSTRCIAPLIIQ